MDLVTAYGILMTDSRRWFFCLYGPNTLTVSVFGNIRQNAHFKTRIQYLETIDFKLGLSKVNFLLSLNGEVDCYKESVPTLSSPSLSVFATFVSIKSSRDSRVERCTSRNYPLYWRIKSDRSHALR